MLSGSGSFLQGVRLLTMICASVVRIRAPRGRLPDSLPHLQNNIQDSGSSMRDYDMYECSQESGAPAKSCPNPEYYYMSVVRNWAARCGRPKSRVYTCGQISSSLPQGAQILTTLVHVNVRIWAPSKKLPKS